MDGSNGASRMDRDRERTLVDRARSDAAAFGELYDFYLPRIYGFVYRRVQERSVAEDLTAATFQRALETLRHREFRNDAFGGWLYRVAANAVVDHVRRGSRAHPPGRDRWLGLRATPSPPPSTRRAARGRSSASRRPIARCWPCASTTTSTADEASAVLGCSRATFAVRLHRAIAALRGAMAQEATDAA